MLKKKEKLNAVIAMGIILTMTLYYFIFIGQVAVSYAIDVIKTNDYNVDFSAYFVDENGEKVDNVTKEIDAEEFLYIDVSVKNEGYFNGEISLENSNFKLKQEILSDGISEIKENKVTLKQINAGNTATIKLGIEATKNSKITKSSLSEKSDILLNGQYVNSLNIEKDGYADIEGTANVTVNWVSNSSKEIELNASLLTNAVYEINGEQKRIVQILINSKLKNNEYPVKETNLKLTVPENAKDVTAFARSTNATNSKIEFNQENYKFDEITNTFTISMKNDNENELDWNKDTEDKIIVTYIFDKDEEMTGKEIEISDSITLYDENEIEKTATILVNEDVDGIVSNEIETNEEYIYKGKIYTGEKREYQSEAKIYINYFDAIDKITAKETEAKFIANDTENTANIIYQSSTIKKDEFIKLLGEDGFINVKDITGNVVASINNLKDADENGNIAINYPEGTKEIIFETSKPKANGTINILNNKAILDSRYSREIVDSLTGIEEGVDTSYNDKETGSRNSKIIELKNTSTKATLEISKENLSTAQTNENIEMVATLNTNGEDLNLYKNPQVEIVFPQEIEDLNIIQAKALYRNGLEIGENDVYQKEDGRQALYVKFNGEEQTYDTNEGVEIHVYLDIDVNDEVPTSTALIEMNYTNENDGTNASFGKEITLVHPQEEEKTAQIEGVTLNIAEGNGQTTTQDVAEGLKASILAVRGNTELSDEDNVYEGETIRYTITLSNNSGNTYENINIKAVQENGKVWNLVEKQMYNAHYEETTYEHFYEVTDSNNIDFEKIEKLENGQTITLTYEATVNEGAEGTTYGTITFSTDDGSINKEIKTVQNTILDAELDIKILETDSREITWASSGIAANEIDIKNITDKELKNVKLQIVMSKELLCEDDYLQLYDYEDEIQIVGNEKNDNGETVITLNIPSIKALETITMLAQPQIADFKEDTRNISMIAKAETATNKEYWSNKQEREVIRTGKKLEIKQRMYLDGNEIDETVEVKDGETLELVTTINNNDSKDAYIEIENNVKPGLALNKVIFVNDGVETDITDEADSKMIDKMGELKAGKEMVLRLNVTVETDDSNDKQIPNEVKIIDIDNQKTYTSIIIINTNKEITDETQEDPDDYLTSDDDDGSIYDNEVPEGGFLEEYTPVNNESNNNQQDPNSGTDNNTGNNNGNQDEETYTIKGTAWVDENKNGMRDSTEKVKAGLKVRIIDANSGSLLDKSTTTASDGTYRLKVSAGKYIVIFNYDTDTYSVTTYQANGVNSSVNSDVISKTISIDGKEEKVAATDEIEVSADVSDIDIGLIKNETFDLKLDKYVSKITVSNKEGTKVKEYQDSNLAKVEIKAKYLKGTTVVIEYKIKVTNNGDIAGYAKKIVDYKPSDLTFNSTLNSNWYQSGNNLYTESLSNVEIAPGESKEVTLILTKTMTEANTGLTNNIAEIAEDNNSLGVEDVNSTPGNKNTKENDQGQANVIISVSTGAAISYISITLSIIIAISLGAWYINKKILVKEI